MQSVLQRCSEPVTHRFPTSQQQPRCAVLKSASARLTWLAKRAAPLGWKAQNGIATTGTTLPCQGTSQISQPPNPLPFFCVLCASADRLLNP